MLTRGLAIIRKSENYALGISGGKAKLPKCVSVVQDSREAE